MDAAAYFIVSILYCTTLMLVNAGVSVFSSDRTLNAAQKNMSTHKNYCQLCVIVKKINDIHSQYDVPMVQFFPVNSID